MRPLRGPFSYVLYFRSWLVPVFVEHDNNQRENRQERQVSDLNWSFSKQLSDNLLKKQESTHCRHSAISHRMTAP